MATIPAHNPSIPFVGLIPGGLHHSRMIRIKGMMKPYADRFSINLQCGPSTDPLDDVALHLDVRPSENAIVRNHYGSEGWGVEERYGGCPIHPGQSYEILILSQSRSYKVAVNGIHFCEFVHRMPMNRVQFIHMNHDTDVYYIGLEEDMLRQPGGADVPSVPSAPPYMVPPTGYVPPPAYSPPGTIPMHQQIISTPSYNPNAAALSYGGVPASYPTQAQPPAPNPYAPYGQQPSQMMHQQFSPYPGKQERW